MPTNIADIEGANIQCSHDNLQSLVVAMPVNPSRSDRGLWRCNHVHTGEPCYRSNSSHLHGCQLGPLRSMAELRRSPWVVNLSRLEGSSLFAMALREGGVCLLDGAVSCDGICWQLVGAKLSVAELESSLPSLALPFVPTCEVTDMLAVGPLDWACLLKPLLMAFNTNGSISIIDPGHNFNMVPLAQGRLATRKDRMTGRTVKFVRDLGQET